MQSVAMSRSSSPSPARSSGRSFERGEKAVRMLAKSLRRLGSVVWLRPAPVTSAESQAECRFCAHGASCS